MGGVENEAFTVHSGPGNEGVFLRDDSKEEDQRAREVKQRGCIRSGGGNYNTDPRQTFLAVTMASDCEALWPKERADAYTYFTVPPF